MDYPHQVTKRFISHVNALSVALTCLVVAGTIACSSSPSGESKAAAAKSSGGLHATIDTDKGPIDLEFLRSLLG